MEPACRELAAGPNREAVRVNLGRPPGDRRVSQDAATRRVRTLAFLNTRPALVQVYRLIVIASVGVGSVLALDVVWGVADIAMAAMALMNLVARRDPEFVAAANSELPGPLVTEVW